MTTEERLEKLERELTAAKQINRWKLVSVALAVSLLCIGLGQYWDTKGISLVPSANAQNTMLGQYFVTEGWDAYLWQINESGILQPINLAHYAKDTVNRKGEVKHSHVTKIPPIP